MGEIKECSKCSLTICEAERLGLTEKKCECGLVHLNDPRHGWVIKLEGNKIAIPRVRVVFNKKDDD